MVHQTGGLSTIFKKVPGIYSFSWQILDARGILCYLISYFRRLETKEHWFFTKNQNPTLVYSHCFFVFFCRLHFYDLKRRRVTSWVHSPKSFTICRVVIMKSCEMNFFFHCHFESNSKEHHITLILFTLFCPQVMKTMFLATPQRAHYVFTMRTLKRLFR